VESADTGRSAARMEIPQVAIDDVVRAGRLLFGPEFALDAGGWRAALKATYRRRAMETHPDRAGALGRGAMELAREFLAVNEAYRLLSRLRPPVARAAPPARAPRGESPAPAAPRRAPAPEPWPPRAAPRPDAGVRPSVPAEELPRRRLRFAEYLYYSGRVRWSELADALAWQRTQRPPIGRIAVELGFLAHDDVGVILERRRLAGANAVPFGEWAVRLGYLTPFQALAALGRQLRAQRPIGQYFVERGILGPDEIEAIRHRIVRHNVRFAE
jgi:hypothetical protein